MDGPVLIVVLCADRLCVELWPEEAVAISTSSSCPMVLVAGDGDDKSKDWAKGELGKLACGDVSGVWTPEELMPLPELWVGGAWGSEAGSGAFKNGFG